MTAQEQERAWLGEKIRDAVMLTEGAAAEVVRLIDGRAFGRHSLPGLRRLGPEMMVPPKWRDWLERRLAGLGPPQSRVQASTSAHTAVRRSERLKHGPGTEGWTRVKAVPTEPVAAADAGAGGRVGGSRWVRSRGCTRGG